MRNNDGSYLLDMLVASRRVLEYTDGVEWDEFLGNQMMQDAVMRQVQIIGEAARMVSAPFRDAHPEIPWPAMVGMRHRLVHHYFAIRVALVWDVVQHDIPALIGWIEPLVPPDQPEEGGVPA